MKPARATPNAAGKCPLDSTFPSDAQRLPRNCPAQIAALAAKYSNYDEVSSDEASRRE